MRVLLLGIVFAAAGCSWIFVNPPRGNPHRAYPISCTESRVAPVVDTIFAASTAFTAGMYATNHEEMCMDKVGQDLEDCQRALKMIIPIAVGEAVVFALSAYYGYTRVERCRDAVDEQRAWWSQQPPGQPTQPYMPPPTPTPTPTVRPPLR